MCSVKAQTELKFKNRKKSKIASKALEQRIIHESINFKPNYNLWIGMKALVITAAEPEYYQEMTFGLTPSWSDKKLYLFNARAEGKLNPENDSNYQAENGIFQMPSFKNAIKSRRCIVPVDYFVEGSEKEKLNDPYLIRRKDKEALVLAGIWEEWVDKASGEIFKSYAIITTAASELMKDIKHHRSPLKLEDEEIDLWLDKNADEQSINNILYPHSFAECEATAIDPIIKSKVNDPGVIKLRTSLF
ncbi:MAG: SOS response-associated peptidase [bacterium]|jgi:putative SOS response-associated peptidase YedK